MNNANNANNANVLFYSQKCNTCMNLLLLLKNEGFLGYFKLVCVDTMLDKLPPNMVVPTMIVVNLNKPLAGQETFEWIKQMKFIRQQQVMDVNKRIIQQNQMNNIKKGPIGFDNDIMGGISDKFAFTKVDTALPHTYVGINDDDKNAIFTAPTEQKKMDKTEHLRNIKDIEEKRNMQDSEYSNFMKQQQIQAVMQAEHEKLGLNNNQNQDMHMMQQQKQQQAQLQQQQYQMMLQQQMMQNNNNNRF